MIVAQMATLQSLYYVSLGLWIFVFDIIQGSPRSLDQIFMYQNLLATQMQGKFLIASFLFNSLTCSLALWYVVQRTKLCLDFTCTVHFFHLLGCWYYNNYTFGHTITWWFINIVCMTIMCVSGEFLCMRTELRAIPVSMTPKADL